MGNLNPALDILFYALAVAAAIGGLMRVGYLWGKERKRSSLLTAHPAQTVPARR